MNLKYLSYICAINPKHMNRLLLNLLALPFLLSSCSNDKVLAPVIKLQSIVVNQNTAINYKDSLNKLPVLYEGDELEMELELDGNGSSLNTLNVSSDNKGIETSFSPLDNGLISDNKNFTDLENGRLGFIDGVLSFPLTVKIKVTSNQVGKSKLSFHLSARAECEGGGVLELEFVTAK